MSFDAVESTYKGASGGNVSITTTAGGVRVNIPSMLSLTKPLTTSDVICAVHSTPSSCERRTPTNIVQKPYKLEVNSPRRRISLFRSIEERPVRL